jgi:GNAT superfamily N-acetyltransferase
LVAVTLSDRALATDAANFALGNETFGLLGATFVRNGASPDIYDANHVAGARPTKPSQVEEFLAAVEREYTASRHRRFEVDYRTPPAFEARLALEGYEREDGLLSVLEGELLGPAPGSCDIRPVETEDDWEAFWELMLKDWREHHRLQKRNVKEEIARQMFGTKRLKQPPVQYFLAHANDRPVAYLNSWAGIDGVGQVEDLFTLPEFRRRGIARALIHHCVADARTKGAGPVIIAADPKGTPKLIYAAMGFRPVAVLSHYTKYLDR